MIGPCVCTTAYFCVSCRVKRGDYTDWRRTPAKPRLPCSASECSRLADTGGLCWKHYSNKLYRQRGYRPRLTIPNSPYIKLADR